MNLSLNRSDDTDTPWLDESLVQSIREICGSLGPAGQTVNLVVVDDAYIREINREFRKIDSPTDVLAFSYMDDEGPGEEDDLAGEVYVSRETVEREAIELGVESGVLFLRVGVHGLLHVVGFDHEDESEASRMEKEEKAILRSYLAATDLEALF